MITHISMSNYRAFKNAQFDLSRLTIIVGPNNSGKSALLSVLGLLSQTLKSGDTKVPLLLRGDLEDLGTYKDAVHGNDRRSHMSFRVEFKLEQLKNLQHKSIALDVAFGYRIQRREMYLSSVGIENPIGQKIYESRNSKDSDRQIVKTWGHPSIEPPKSVRNNHFLAGGFLMQETNPNSYRIMRQIDTCSRSLLHNLSSLEFIGPFRVAPSRTYLFSGESPAAVGRSGERAVDVLVSDYLRRGSKQIGITSQVGEWLARCSIAKDIDVNVLTDRHFEIVIEHPITEEKQNLADVGYGCSQVLPILVAGFNRLPGETLLVEQPEIHLHPKAQAELGDFFVQRALNGVQCIIETHSEHLLLRIQAAVASLDNDLKASDVCVYYVHAPNNQGKILTRLKLRDDGIFVTDWPDGFFPERSEEVRRLALNAMLRSEHEGTSSE